MNVFVASRYPHLQALVEGKPDASRTLAENVRDEILKRIVGNEMPAGTPLTTTAVAEMFGVSRTPAAKALSTLVSDGILQQEGKQHAVVRANAASWLDQCRTLRSVIEPEAAAAAAGQLPEHVLGDLWALSREAAPTRDYDWVPAAVFFDAGLHLSIAEYCGNLPMMVTIRRYWNYKQLAYHLYQPSRKSLEPEYHQHVEILKALAQGEGEAAWIAMVKHLRASWRAKDGKLMATAP
jgi:DNA-binding GntR family transcriptional regulator